MFEIWKKIHNNGAHVNQMDMKRVPIDKNHAQNWNLEVKAVQTCCCTLDLSWGHLSAAIYTVGVAQSYAAI